MMSLFVIMARTRTLCNTKPAHVMQTADQGALLRQLNESQALLREQIALNAKHTNTIDNYMVENEALRGQLNTHQRILLDMHDQLVALVQLHKLTVGVDRCACLTGLMLLKCITIIYYDTG